MKKLIYKQYGGQAVMNWTETATPTLQCDEILVKIISVSLNPVDWKIRNGDMKIVTGKKFPKGMGCDFAGIIEETGQCKTDLKKGDEVFGWIPYKYANSIGEFAVAKENLTIKKPSNLSFTDVSCLPMSGVTALKALTTYAEIKIGDEVLINGCTGGVGIFAVQIAKSFGAIVTGTCNSASIETAQKIGVDKILDYSVHDVLRQNKKFSVIFDTAGKLKFSQSKQIMTDKSWFLNLNATPLALIASLFTNIFTNKKQKIIMMSVNKQDLENISKFATDKKIVPIIGKRYDISDALIAMKNFENGEKVIGKTVLSIEK
jgi:NADPH:quinone reductase-like Zn-dependent oxidoreductase